MSELGVVAAMGMASIDKLIVIIRDDEGATIPDAARMALKEMAAQIDALTARVERLDRDIIATVKGDEEARRLTSIPGVGPILRQPSGPWCRTVDRCGRRGLSHSR